MTGEEKNRKIKRKDDERIGYDPEDRNPNPTNPNPNPMEEDG
jgi:hypothetical protein